MRFYKEQIPVWAQQLIDGRDGAEVVAEIEKKCKAKSTQSSTISRVRRLVIEANLPVDDEALRVFPEARPFVQADVKEKIEIQKAHRSRHPRWRMPDIPCHPTPELTLPKAID